VTLKAEEASFISQRRRSYLTVALLVGTFLASIEVTVVAAAMPSIVESLGGLSLYPWVFSAYLLTQTISIPLYGRLADLYGRRNTYVVGVAIFLLGSALAGFSTSMQFLVAARALQGLGAGSVLPLTMTIFGDLFEVSVRTKLQGLFSLVWGISALLGPLAGGTIVQHLSWRWVFFLNLPFGLISGAIVALLLLEGKTRRQHRLDSVGAASLAIATLSVLVGLLPAEQRPLGLDVSAWMLLALAAFGLLLYWERGHPEPIIPLGLFRDRVHVAANFTGVLLGGVLFSLVSYLPLYVQGVLGGTPLMAGAVLIPLSLGWTTASIVGGRVVWQVGFRFLVRTGCALIAIGIVGAYYGVISGQLLLALAGECVYGLGMGACISSFTVSVQEQVSFEKRGIATALTQFSRSIGGAIGVAVFGAVLASQLGPQAMEARSGLQTLREAAQLEEGLILVFGLQAVTSVAAAVLGIALFPGILRQPGQPQTISETVDLSEKRGS
jgi:EmrB/QacA subfamily drug resistance transporter